MPQKVIQLILTLTSLFSAPYVLGADGKAPRSWSGYVANCLDTLIKHGTDRYGLAHSPLFMAVLDPHTLQSPENPEVLDGLVRLGGRLHRRGDRGSNLWNDQSTLRAMYYLAKRDGKEAYAAAADAYIDYALQHCRKGNGLLTWGSHIHWDCYRDRAGGDGDGSGPHEPLINHALWQEMYRVNPGVVKLEIDGIWQWHVHDKQTGNHNRHDDGVAGFDFPEAGGPFAVAFAFMHSVTPEDTEYLRRAKLVTDWHWNARDPGTKLTGYIPGRGKAVEQDAFYGSSFLSATSGPHASNLLLCYELTGDAHFREVAVAYVKAYDKYAWDAQAKTFHGMLNLDGTRTTLAQVPSRMKSQVFAFSGKEPDVNHSIPPIGHIDIWPTYIYPINFPLITTQATIYAYEMTRENDRRGDPELLAAARHWAEAIEAQLPMKPGRTYKKTLEAAMPRIRETGGSYADNYGRVISFFVHLYQATDDKRYLALAERVAQDAVDRLYVETERTDEEGARQTVGLFKGHAAKRNYEASDGVGILLYALLELDHPTEHLGGAF